MTLIPRVSYDPNLRKLEDWIRIPPPVLQYLSPSPPSIFLTVNHFIPKLNVLVFPSHNLLGLAFIASYNKVERNDRVIFNIRQETEHIYGSTKSYKVYLLGSMFSQ